MNEFLNPHIYILPMGREERTSIRRKGEAFMIVIITITVTKMHAIMMTLLFIIIINFHMYRQRRPLRRRRRAGMLGWGPPGSRQQA